MDCYKLITTTNDFNYVDVFSTYMAAVNRLKSNVEGQKVLENVTSTYEFGEYSKHKPLLIVPYWHDNHILYGIRTTSFFDNKEYSMYRFIVKDQII